MEFRTFFNFTRHYVTWIYHLISERERGKISGWHVSLHGDGSAEFKSALRDSFFQSSTLVRSRRFSGLS